MKSYNPPCFAGPRAWFPQAKFGMFVHFGLYALRGGNENDYDRTSKANYERLIHRFNPKLFKANEWVHLAEAGGCRYIVLTAKHGEGFCLWDSKHTAYKITNTPFDRDLVGELAVACRRRGMRFGLYYGTGGDNHYQEPGEGPSEARTFAGYFEAQIRELFTGYGRIDEIWFDGSDPRLPKPFMKRMLTYIRRRQPSCVINDRGFSHHVMNPYGDFVTPERYFPQIVAHPHAYIEACDSMGQKSWGYHRQERFWSTAELIRRLSRAASLGGNYLLNVEPMPDGRIRPECVERLRAMGQWLKTNGEAIFKAEECRALPMETSVCQEGLFLDESHKPIGVSTCRQSVLYLHLHQWPLADHIQIPYVSGKVRTARLLGMGRSLDVKSTPGGLILSGLPAEPPSSLPTVVNVTFAGRWQFDEKARRQGARPQIISLSEHTPTYLPAEAAELTTRDGVPWHTISKFRNGSVWITNYYRLDGRVIWRLTASRAGTYDLYADLFAKPHKRDAEFCIAIAGQILKARMGEGGSLDEPLRLKLGRVKIPKGRHTLTYSLLNVPYCSGPDINRLVLVPTA